MICTEDLAAIGETRTRYWDNAPKVLFLADQGA